MGKAVDITGRVFGELTALKPVGKHIGNGVVWLCLCSCGKEKSVARGHLKSGNTKSCGHLWEKHHLTGHRFGRWTVIGLAPKKYNQNKIWCCRCSCGNTSTINQQTLLEGISKSCGCYNSELTSARNFIHGMSNTPAYKSFQEVKRRAKTNLLHTDVTEDAMQEKLLAQNYQCHWCDDFFDGKTPHRDHVVPLCKGGIHTLDNVVWACAPCNTQKNGLLPHDWFAKAGCRAQKYVRCAMQPS